MALSKNPRSRTFAPPTQEVRRAPSYYPRRSEESFRTNNFHAAGFSCPVCRQECSHAQLQVKRKEPATTGTTGTVTVTGTSVATTRTGTFAKVPDHQGSDSPQVKTKTGVQTQSKAGTPTTGPETPAPTDESFLSALEAWAAGLTRSDWINLYATGAVLLIGVLGDLLLPQRCRCLLLSDSVNCLLICVGLAVGAARIVSHFDTLPIGLASGFLFGSYIGRLRSNCRFVVSAPLAFIGTVLILKVIGEHYGYLDIC